MGCAALLRQAEFMEGFLDGVGSVAASVKDDAKSSI